MPEDWGNTLGAQDTLNMKVLGAWGLGTAEAFLFRITDLCVTVPTT